MRDLAALCFGCAAVMCLRLRQPQQDEVGREPGRAELAELVGKGLSVQGLLCAACAWCLSLQLPELTSPSQASKALCFGPVSPPARPDVPPKAKARPDRAAQEKNTENSKRGIAKKVDFGSDVPRDEQNVEPAGRTYR